jgi:hypothetical protein
VSVKGRSARLNVGYQVFNCIVRKAMGQRSPLSSMHFLVDGGVYAKSAWIRWKNLVKTGLLDVRFKTVNLL